MLTQEDGEQLVDGTAWSEPAGGGGVAGAEEVNRIMVAAEQGAADRETMNARPQRISKRSVGAARLSRDQGRERRDFWPADALDGQSGGADGGQGPAGLMSFRYPDRATAAGSFDRFTSAVASCPTLRSSRKSSPDMKVREQTGIDSSDTSVDVVLTGVSDRRIQSS